MIAVNYSNLRENLKDYCDKATQDFETIVVTRKDNQNVVLLSEAEYNNLVENNYIRSSKNNYDRLLNSINNANTEKVTARELLEDE